MLSFLFVDKRELFPMKLSFEEFNLVFFTADQSAWVILNQPRQRGFWRNLRYILFSMINENYIIIKVSWTFSTFWHRCERKTTKCAFEIDVFAMCTASRSTIQLVNYCNHMISSLTLVLSITIVFAAHFLFLDNINLNLTVTVRRKYHYRNGDEGVIINLTSPELLFSQDLDQFSRLRRSEDDQ